MWKKTTRAIHPSLFFAALTLSFTLLRAVAGTALPASPAAKPNPERPEIPTPEHSYNARVEKTQYKGWDTYKLTNGIISLYIAPAIGGRAIQLQLGSQEFFFVNHNLEGKVLPESENNLKAGWANYGGDKVWPAPEGWLNGEQWPSIPYYSLDGSRFQSEIVKDTPQEVAVRVTSPSDPRTGVQMERTFHIYAGTTRVTVDQVMRNTSQRRIRWGIWHLTQNDAADMNDPSKPNPELYMYIPVNPHSMFYNGYSIAYGDARHPSYQLVEDGHMMRVHYLYRVGKITLDSNAGWFAVVNGQKQIGYVESFDYFPGKEYPDNASVESWNEGPGTISRVAFDQVLPDDPAKTPYFLEAEMLSPFAPLDPGQQYEFSFHWSAASVPYPLVGAKWAGVVSAPFTASLLGSKVKLNGVFGVFTPGMLVANFYSPMGEELGHVDLQPVDPRQVVILDKIIPLPQNTFRTSVSVNNLDGQNLGDLGNVVLK
ncbi:MAG TPA: DUF4380 domain-containing protein [Terriglobia bacterium]|nr:DUF4380 domain-containing protein [Terriglobia bacterium]